MGPPNFTAATAATHRAPCASQTFCCRADSLETVAGQNSNQATFCPMDFKNATANPLSVGTPLKNILYRSRAPVSRGRKIACLRRPRCSRPCPAWRGGGNQASSGLVIGVKIKRKKRNQGWFPKSPPCEGIVSDAQGAQVQHTSQRPLLPILGRSELETKTPSKL